MHNHDPNLGGIGPLEDWIADPVAGGDGTFVERHFLMKGDTDAHQAPGLDLPFQLQWIHDDSRVDYDGHALDLDHPGGGSDRHVSCARPEAVVAEDDGYSATVHESIAPGGCIRIG